MAYGEPVGASLLAPTNIAPNLDGACAFYLIITLGQIGKRLREVPGNAPEPIEGVCFDVNARGWKVMINTEDSATPAFI